MVEDAGIQGIQSNLLDESIFKALDDLKIFSIMAIVVFILAIVGYVILISSFTAVISQVTRGITNKSEGGYLILTGFLFALVSILLELISFVFLRAAFRILKEKSWKFKSAYTGMNLFFAGLIVLLMGIVLIFSTVKLAVVYTLFGGLILVVIGGIIAFVGEIMGLIMGSFRLRDYFQESRFGTAGIMYIIGIFISVFSLVGALFMYMGVKNVITRLSAAKGNNLP